MGTSSAPGSTTAGDADLRTFLGCSAVCTVGEDEASRISVYFPTEKVAVTRVVGTLTTRLAQTFEDTLAPRISRGDFVGIHDWTDMSGYDFSVAPRLAAWTVARLPKISRIVIACNDPLTSMAVRTANLSIKRIEHLTTRAQFFAALEPLLGRRSSNRP